MGSGSGDENQSKFYSWFFLNKVNKMGCCFSADDENKYAVCLFNFKPILETIKAFKPIVCVENV